MNRAERVSAIKHGLVGNQDDHALLYHGNATFHAAVDQLAEMLLPMVDGLARDAEGAEDDRQAALAAVRVAPLGGYAMINGERVAVRDAESPPPPE